MICLIMFAMLLFWRRFKNCDGKQRLKTLHHTVPANIFIQYLHSSIQTPKRKTIKKTLSRTKINVQVNQESHTNKIGNRQDIYISIRASSFWQSSPRNCCLLMFAYPILPVTCPDIGCLSKYDKQHQNSNKIRKHRKLILNPCFPNFISTPQTPTSDALSKEPVPAAYKTSQGTKQNSSRSSRSNNPHKKQTTTTTTTTTTKEEGRKLRRKDEGQRTNVEGRGRTHIPGDQLCMFTVFGLPAIVLGGLDNWLLKKSMCICIDAIS